MKCCPRRAPRRPILCVKVVQLLTNSGVVLGHTTAAFESVRPAEHSILVNGLLKVIMEVYTMVYVTNSDKASRVLPAFSRFCPDRPTLMSVDVGR